MENTRTRIEEQDTSAPELQFPDFNFVALMMDAAKPAVKQPPAGERKTTADDRVAPPVVTDQVQPATDDKPALVAITHDQENALNKVMGIRSSLFQSTEGGQKALPPNQWAPVDAQFKKALEDAKSVKPEQLSGLVAGLDAQYLKELSTIRKNPSLTSVQAEEQRKATIGELNASHNQMDAVIKALTPDKRATYEALQTKFVVDVQAKEAELSKKGRAELAGKSPAEQEAIARKYTTALATENQQLAAKLLEDKKALTPELKTALATEATLMAKPETKLVLEYSALSDQIDRLKLAPDMIKLYYAQALAIQGDLPNARTYFNEALKNPAVTNIIDNTAEGTALAEKLGIKTPAQRSREEEIARKFPELKKVDDAVKLIADAQSKTPAEQKTAFAAAGKLFDEALTATNRESVKVEELRSAANAIRLQLVLAETDIKKGKRTDFTAAEREQFEKMQELLKKAESASVVRYRYALALNEYGFNHDDNAAKAKAIEILKSVKDVDAQTFTASPELQGALKQANDGKRINPATAAVEAFNAVLEQESARHFPEAKKVDDAIKLITDAKAKTPAEQKTAFVAACKLFDDALAATDRNVRKVEDLRAAANAIKLQLEIASKDIQAGKRADLTADEKELSVKMQLLVKQAESVAAVRFRYALALNDHGFNHDDAAAKTKAIEILESIKEHDPQVFAASPEVQGALKQAKEGKRIDPATAPAEAYVAAAKNTILSHNTGLIDWAVPGGSALANTLSGERATELPLAGPILFGGGKDMQTRTTMQLAQAYLSNPESTQEQVDRAVNQGHSSLREVTTDVAAVAVGLGTRYGLNGYISKLGTPGKIGGFVLAVGAAGLTKDLTVDGELGTGKDWLRGGGMYGMSVLAMKGMALNPTRAALTTETLGANGMRFGVEGLTGNGANMTRQIWAARAALQQEVRAAATAEARQAAAANLTNLEAQLGGSMGRFGQHLNPLNYTGLQWNGGLRWVGMGGERAAAEMAAGRMTFAQFNARRAVGNFLSTGGAAFAFGAGREGLYIGTGGTMTFDSSPKGLVIGFDLGKNPADDTDYTFDSALKEMSYAGLNTSLAATLMLPVAAGSARAVGLGAALDGTGYLASRALTRQGAVAAGDLALVAAGPVLRRVEESNNATQLQKASEEAKRLVAEAKEKVRIEQARKDQANK